MRSVPFSYFLACVLPPLLIWAVYWFGVGYINDEVEEPVHGLVWFFSTIAAGFVTGRYVVSSALKVPGFSPAERRRGIIFPVLAGFLIGDFVAIYLTIAPVSDVGPLEAAARYPLAFVKDAGVNHFLRLAYLGTIWSVVVQQLRTVDPDRAELDEEPP